MNLDRDEMILTISQTLENAASAWFDISQSSIKSFEDFQTKFISRFWNEDIQEEWSRKVEYNHYNPNSKYNRLEYATYVWGFAQDLGKNYSEAELVKKISNHFEWDIKYTVRTHGIQTQDKFFELLALKDSGPNQGKSAFEPSKAPAKKSDILNVEVSESNTNPNKFFNTQQSNYNKQNFQNKFNFQKQPQVHALNVIESKDSKIDQTKEKGAKPKDNSSQKSKDSSVFDETLDSCLKGTWRLPKNQ